MFKAVFTASLEIEADIHDVWNTLVEFDKYHEWNSFTPEVDIALELGYPVVLTVMMDENKKPIFHKAKLTTLDPPNKIGWTMNWGPLLTAERVQILKSLDNGRTHYATFDTNVGLLASIVDWFYGKKITAGFEKVALSLQQRVQSKSRSTNT